MEEGSNSYVGSTGVPVSIVRIVLRTHIPLNAHPRDALSAICVQTGNGCRISSNGGQEILHTIVAMGFSQIA